MEPGFDVLVVNFLKCVKKPNCLVCGEVVKNCNIIIFYKSMLIIFDVMGSFGLMFTQWICCTLLCTLCALNASICCRYYTQSRDVPQWQRVSTATAVLMEQEQPLHPLPLQLPLGAVAAAVN